MKLFVGLGNPGPEHAGQRHNIGFMAADALHAAHGFPAWRSKFQAAVADGRIDGHRVLLMKPQSYMNRSGQAVGEATRYLKLAPQDVIVFHDELDLAPGKVRVKTGGGHAGHNGLRSIHAHLGPDYRRVRLGIGHPGRKELVTGYVLHDFAAADRDWLEPLLAALAGAAPALAAGDDAGFMNRLALARASEAGASPPGRTARRPEPAAGDGDKARDKAGNGAGENGEPATAGSLLERLARHFSGRH